MIFIIPNDRVAISVRRAMGVSYPNAQVGDRVEIDAHFFNMCVPVRHPIRLHGLYRVEDGVVDDTRWESIRDALEATGEFILLHMVPPSARPDFVAKKKKRNWITRETKALPLP